MKLFLLSFLLCSCSSLQHVVTSDNVLRAVEIGENAGRIWRDGKLIFDSINEPVFSAPTK